MLSPAGFCSVLEQETHLQKDTLGENAFCILLY